MLKNLYTAAFYEKSCFLVKILVLVTACLMHLSGYMIAIIEVDRYLRIKYYAKFKNHMVSKNCIDIHMFWISACFLSSGNDNSRFGIRTRSICRTSLLNNVVGMIIILQVKTVRTSRDMHNMSTVATSERINKKVTK